MGKRPGTPSLRAVHKHRFAHPSVGKDRSAALSVKMIGAVRTVVAWGAAYLLFLDAQASTISETWTRAKQAVVEIDALDNNGNLLKTGTGFFVNGDGLAITARHVVEGTSHVVGVSAGGTHYACQRVAYAPSGVNLALIKFDAPNVSYLPLGSSRNAAEGQTVLVAGPPSGLPGTDSNGVISGFPDHHRLIQITAPIWPGSSGSPVLNRKGEVI